MISVLKRWATRLRGVAPVRRILIFGDSHTVAIAQAMAFRGDASEPMLPAIELYRLRKAKGNEVLGDTDLEQFCRIISQLEPTDAVFSAVGGNQYAVASTVRARPYFDLAPRIEIGDLSRGECELIPTRVLEGYISSGVVNSDGPMLRRIRASTRARVFHITPPPPKQDNDFIKEFHETRFAEEGLGNLEPHAPELRLACWNMQRSCLAAFCAEIGVELLPPPPATVGEHGYLERHYYGKDVTHANRRYGEQVLRQIAAVADSSAVVAP